MGIASDLYPNVSSERVCVLMPVVSMYGWHAGFLVGLLGVQSGEKRRNDMGGLPKIGEHYPPNHPFVHRVFHYFRHPFWWFYPYFWKHPYQHN